MNKTHMVWMIEVMNKVPLESWYFYTEINSKM